jgi:hypothetical protein
MHHHPPGVTRAGVPNAGVPAGGRPRCIHRTTAAETRRGLWRSAARTSYSVSSGGTPAAAGAHLLKSIARGAAGRRSVAVRLRKADRWIGLRGLKGSTRSRMVVARAR